MTRTSFAAAALVSLIAFTIFRLTMLPGIELGDSASFQVMAGSATLTPRDAYPLYFAIADLIHWIVGGEPAHALNLTSVIEGALACGVIVLAAAELSGSLAAGVAAAMIFAGSYTFWSQAIITEVYALHMLMVALTLLLLLHWERNPSLGRLTWFFAVYAIGFGNHLTMIFLLPAYAMFILAVAPRGWRSVMTPAVLSRACLFAVLGASQYLWNLHTLWFTPTPPTSLADGLSTFWYDVTKSDWRAVMVANVPSADAGQRMQMYAFDLHQQFGWVIPIAALTGLTVLAWKKPARAALMAMAYVINAAFALTYNVGDAHVFFLPSHLVIALLVAPAIVFAGDIFRSRAAVAAAAIAIASMGIYRNYPLLDRHDDQRPLQILSVLTAGLDDHREILLTDQNWQLENGLTYAGKHDLKNVAHVLVPDVLPHASALIRDNRDVGRSIALTERARAIFDTSYGTVFQSIADPRAKVTTVADLVGGLAPRTRYVLCVLTPAPPFAIDRSAVNDIARTLTGGRVSSIPADDYVCLAGLAGEEPILNRSASSPFRESITLDGLGVSVAMESWLRFDTIRRMGFGQVVAARRHTLIVERGVSFVAINSDGTAMKTGYDANIFTPEPRYLVRAR